MTGKNLLKGLGVAAYIVCGVLVVMFVLPFFGWKAMEVMTPSMKPAISPGDLVIVHRVPLTTIHPGNVVTYINLHETGTTITHRVVSVKTINGVPSYIVKGDANKSPDAPVSAGQVVGRVALTVPGAGKLASILHNPIGLLALVIIPAIYVIWSEVNNLRRLLKKPIRRSSRRLDGVYRAILVFLVVGLVSSLGGATFAQLTSTATLTDNMFSVGATTPPSPSPTPTASPSPTPCSVSITNTGPGSTNIVHCSQTSSSSSSSSTNISVSNSSTQTATSGGITIQHNTTSSATSPGSTSNSSSSVTNISITK